MIRSLGIRQYLRHLLSQPNREAIFIFGMPKSGTSAIAGLLAAATSSSVTIDTKYLWEPYQSQILAGTLPIETHVHRYSYPFSKDIIKEPTTTYFISQLSTYFSLSKYVFIVRNPLDNIQSVLSRLGLPGDLGTYKIEEVNPNWRYIFEGKESKNYVEILADRWILANGQTEVIESSNCTLVRYEDFNADKANYIATLANKLELEQKNSIEHLTEKAFQPRNTQRMQPIDFFGRENYEIIASKCAALCHNFGYEIKA